MHYGVELWVPEVGGAVDPGSEAHDLVMSLYGGMSKGERNRIKTRVRSAMAAQAAIEGRFLGGRPPYGYRLADAGPHPNPAKAATASSCTGSRPTRSRRRSSSASSASTSPAAGSTRSPRVSTATASRRQRRTTRSATGIARAAGPWSKRAVRAILANPRYTGVRSGTSNARTRCSSTSRTSRSATRPRCAGTTERLDLVRPSPTHEADHRPRARSTPRRRCSRERSAARTRDVSTQRRHLPARRADALRRLRPPDARQLEPRPGLLPMQAAV